MTETNTGREDGGKEREVVVTEGDRDREKEVKSIQAGFFVRFKDENKTETIKF